MEEVVNFIFTTIESEKPTLKQILSKVSANFKFELAQSDITFIERKYSEILLMLWKRECEILLEDMLTKKSEVNVDEIKKLLHILESENINEIGNSMLNNDTLELIKKETDGINFRNACKKIFNFLRDKTVKIEYEFYEAIIEVLRNSFPFYDKYVDEILKLNDFVSGKISLHEIVKCVSNVESQNVYFDGLKRKAANVLSILLFEDYIRDEIKEYINEISIVKEEKNGLKIVEIKKKFLTSAEVIKFSSDADEIQIICDIFHINDDLPKEFRGKSIAIYANYVHVHKTSQWDLSGVDANHSYDSDAGQTSGVGNDGSDGYAGESGGNLNVECKSITNALNWTIISNGGNGSNGQNGGNGEDGKNGKDVHKSDFTLRGKEIRMFTAFQSLRNILWDNGVTIHRHNLIYEHAYGNFVDDGLVKQIFYEYDAVHYLMYFVQGTKGTAGKNGGLAGRGGNGGYNGEIFIRTIENESSKEIIILKNNRDIDGKNGIGGYNGLSGRDGRDLAFYDRNLWYEAKYYGEDGHFKYEIKYTTSRDDYSIWQGKDYQDKNKYAYISKKSTISTIKKSKQRNETKVNKALQLHAKAKMKSPILIQDIKNKYASFLEITDKNIYNERISSDAENIHTVYQLSYRKRRTNAKEKKVTIDITVMEFEEIFKLLKDNVFATALIKALQYQKVNMETLKKFEESLSDNADVIMEDEWAEMFSENENLAVLTEAFQNFKMQKNSNIKIMNYLTAKEGTNENLNANFLDYLSKSEPFFVYNHFKILSRKKFNCNDVKILTNEKLRLIQFKELLNPFFDINSDENTVKMPENIENIIPYLFETNETEYTDYDVNENFLSYDDRKILTRCLTSLFYLLIHYKEQLEEINEILLKYKEKYEKTMQMKITTKDYDLDEKKLNDGFKIIANFFIESEIKEFIKENVIEHGPTSPIYRALLAYEYDVNLMVFVTSIDGNFLNIENHNKYADKKVLVLLRNEKIYKLKFNMEKYKIYHKMEQITNNCMALFTGVQYSSIFKQTPSDNYFTFGNLFDNNDKYWLKEEALIDSILQKFNGGNISELDEMRLYLSAILQANGLPLLIAINMRFYNEIVDMNLNEFSTIITTILPLVSQYDYLIKYFTFLFISKMNTEWLTELILLAIENKLYKVWIQHKKLWRNILNAYKHREILILFLNKIEEEEDTMNEDDMNAVMNHLKYFASNNYQFLLNVKLKSWQYEISTEYWVYKLLSIMPELDNKDMQLFDIWNKLQTKFNKTILNKLIDILSLKKNQLKKFDMKQFLSKFANDEWTFNDDTMVILKNNQVEKWIEMLKNEYDVKKDQRSISDIIHLIKVDTETSEFIKNQNNDLFYEANKILEESKNLKRKFDEALNEKNSIERFDITVTEWVQKLKSGEELFNPIKALKLIIVAIQYKTKNKITMRNTQIISILTLWNNDVKMNGTLMQVGTGEGKTYIAIAFAILKVLNRQNVDILTSSSILAERDALDEENLKIFNTFGITVDHNCYEDKEKRKKAYKNSNVIYGVLQNFQRDYLLTEFYEQNFLSNHHFENVIVDEVDSMLLDKGSNILYLSQDLPDIDEIENVFYFIWQCINENNSDMDIDELSENLKTENVRKIVLDIAYGIVEEGLIKRMLPENSSIDCKKLLRKLQSNNIIDNESVIIMNIFNDEIIQNALSTEYPQVLINKIKFLIKDKIESEKQVKIPKYLKKFVMLHLDRWIESAIRALLMEHNDQFTIDRDRSGTTSNFDPSVIILDTDTGTDQSNSQWDEGLHQFLQLKYGCKLSLTSLKSVFISNVSYFKMYKKIYGLSGTLGALQERKQLEGMYKLNFVTIPLHLPKKFIEYESILTNTSEEWLETVKDEVLETFSKNRSALIICETIKNLEIIQNKMKNENTIQNIHVYQRDYDKLNIGELKPKNLIIATNLAGRGTDIKLSPELKESGGLHVILSYLPSNVRIENQAFGRASRAGNKGSARLIIYSTSDEQIPLKKQMRDENELVRLQNINSYYKNFISIEESFFMKFKEAFKNFSLNLDENLEEILYDPSNFRKYTIELISDEMKKGCSEVKEILLENFKIKWTFWMDENSRILEKSQNDQQKSIISNSLNKLISKFKNISYKKVEPVTRLKLFKWFAKNDRLDEARDILQEDFQDDSIAFNYYKTCIGLMINQKNTNYEQRDLDISETKSLKLCLNSLRKREHLKSTQIHTINAIKEKFRCTLIPIDALQKQQNKICEFENIFANNIEELLGKDVNPQTFHTTILSNDLLKNDIHDILHKNNFIGKVKISDVLFNEAIDKIAIKYQISPIELRKFLKNKQNFTFNTLDDLSETLKKEIKFSSRESFWENLLNLKILTNEQKFAVIDLDSLSKIDPSEVERLTEILKTIKLKQLPVDKNTNVYIDDIKTDNAALKDENKMIAVSLNDLKSNISGIKIKHFTAHNCIKIHKRANFESKTYDELKSNKIFENFDEINLEDFKVIVSDPKDIIENLRKQKILTENNRLNYEHMKNIDMTDNFIYERRLIELISQKFAFRIALEKIALKIDENIEIENQIIHLYSHPHILIVHDLIENLMIDAGKVNYQNLNKINDLSIFRKYISQQGISDILSKGNIDCNLSLFKEIKSKNMVSNFATYFYNKYKNSYIKHCFSIPITFNNKTTTLEEIIKNLDSSLVDDELYEQFHSFLDDNELQNFFIKLNPFKFLINELIRYITSYIIETFDINEQTLSKNSHVEKTIKLLLQNRRLIIENKDDIINKYKKCVMPLRDDNFERPKFVLKSIDDFCNKNDEETINFMKLKGLDMILKVEEKKWTGDYFFRFSMIILIGITQIAIGVALTILTSSTAAQIGNSFINEGIGDIIFAVNTLKTGHFRWSDYGNHKLISVVTTVAMFGASMAFSKLNIIKMKSTAFGDKLGKGFAGKSGLNMLKQTDKIVKAAKRTMLKQFAQGVRNNSLKALSMAFVSMGADYVAENLLNNLIIYIASKIVTMVQENFNEHQIINSIDNMLKFYTIQETENIIDTKIKKVLTDNASGFLKNANKIGSKIDEILQSGNDKNNILSLISTGVVKTAALGTMIYFIRIFLDELNIELDRQIKSIPTKKDIVNQPNNDEIAKMKLKISDDIQKKLSEEMKKEINNHITLPILKFIGNSTVNKAVELYKSIKLSRNEAKLSKQAKEIETALDKLKKKENLSESELKEKKFFENKAMKILRNTRNPKLYGLMNKLDVPMTNIGVEAAAILVANILGKDVQIVIEHEGILHSFGEGSKIVALDLKDNHFANSDSSSINNDCLYNALAEQIPELQAMLDSNSFRQEIAFSMETNVKIKHLISNTNKKFFHDIDFYGGFRQPNYDGDQKIIKIFTEMEGYEENMQVGTYEQLKERYKIVINEYNSNTNNEIQLRRYHLVEFDHIPPQSIFSKFANLHRDDMPCIALEYKDHRNLASSNMRNSENQKFIEKITNLFETGNIQEGLKHYFVDLHNTSVLNSKIDGKIINEDHRNFPGYRKKIEAYLDMMVGFQYQEKGTNTTKTFLDGPGRDNLKNFFKENLKANEMYEKKNSNGEILYGPASVTGRSDYYDIRKERIQAKTA